MTFFNVKQARSATISFLALACVAFAVPAAATTWDGDTSTKWQTGTNWGGDVAPGPGDAAVGYHMQPGGEYRQFAVVAVGGAHQAHVVIEIGVLASAHGRMKTGAEF